MMDGEPEAYTDETLRSIGISPRERLARIEALLVTIDDKLDMKADRHEVVALELRVRKIETEGTRHESEALNEAHRAEEHIRDLEKLDAEYKQLRSDHNDLSKKIAYAGGAVAVLVIISEFILGHVFAVAPLLPWLLPWLLVLL